MKKSLLLTLFFTILSTTCILAQQASDTITDATGEPLIGASVVIKGTSDGTVTSMKAEDLNPGANVSVDQMILG
ncbi:MAG: hypothetical protein AAF960_16930 [Bacteroidota bacterium]